MPRAETSYRPVYQAECRGNNDRLASSNLLFAVDVRTLIVLTYLFGLLGAITALLVGVGFSLGQREQHQFLRIMHEERLQLIIATVVFWIIAYGANLWKDFLTAYPLLTATDESGRGFPEKVTPAGLAEELKEAAGDLASQAKAYFRAGEYDFSAKRYRDAAGSYEKSVIVIPSASAYLNLGVSLFYGSDFRRAEEAFNAGLQIARKKKNARLEGAFLGSLGLVYDSQGNLEAALRAYQAASDIFRKVGTPQDRAHLLTNIGVVHYSQGKPAAALDYYRGALELYNRVATSLGRQMSSAIWVMFPMNWASSTMHWTITSRHLNFSAKRVGA